ncbi:MAG: hypothetical protein RR515_05080 [Clostridium sp.]
MKARSRLFIFGLMVVLIAVVIGGGYAYLNYDRIDIKDKLLLKDSDIYEGNTKQRPLNKGVFVLTDNIKDHKGTYSAFTSVGYDVLSGNFEEYEKNTGYDGAFIFPESESDKLTNKQVDKIISNIENGQKVIVMGKTKLAKAIGMDVKYSKMINEYIMTGHSDTKIESKKRFKSYQFKSPEGFSTLATNSIDGTPVMSSGNRGKGKIIY